jgi:hypothetical protein
MAPAFVRPAKENLVRGQVNARVHGAISSMRATKRLLALFFGGAILLEREIASPEAFRVGRAARALQFAFWLVCFSGAALEAEAETKVDFWHSYKPPGGPIHYSFRIASYKRGIFFGSCGPSTRSLQWEYDIDLAGPGPNYQKEQVNITSAGKRIDVVAGTISIDVRQRETSIRLQVHGKAGVADFLGNGRHSIRERK